MDNAIRFRAAAAALLLAGGMLACSPAYVRDPAGAAGAGGSGGSGAGGIPGTPSPSSTGGAGGGTAGTGGGPAGTGGAAGTGGVSGAGGVGGAQPPDARPAPPPPPPRDAPAPPPDTRIEPDAPDNPEPEPIGSDAGTVILGDGGIAVCFSNPQVVAICRQLEPACQNCPPGGAPPGNQTAAACFALIQRAIAGQATDEDCVEFFEDNNCTVDNGGNVCGSLNCNATGCNRAMCSATYENGDSVACMRFLAACPCR